ncbi:hypothetical protein KIPB_001138 [Kipferlia bialata]|uniref:RING-type domain-containing protein n=1 Tax=Kipferlia bialata TaxID=797122 RepID=A0A9K3GDY7_9EUKA|nr:hypothetical protein KIPB_001138 [Kipferlia bialata]|eukprot:g1138.t1
MKTLQPDAIICEGEGKGLTRWTAVDVPIETPEWDWRKRPASTPLIFTHPDVKLVPSDWGVVYAIVETMTIDFGEDTLVYDDFDVYVLALDTLRWRMVEQREGVRFTWFSRVFVKTGCIPLVKYMSYKKGDPPRAVVPEASLKCSICSDGRPVCGMVHSSFDWSITACGHTFHTTCIQCALRERERCPTCNHILRRLTYGSLTEVYTETVRDREWKEEIEYLLDLEVSLRLRECDWLPEVMERDAARRRGESLPDPEWRARRAQVALERSWVRKEAEARGDGGEFREMMERERERRAAAKAVRLEEQRERERERERRGAAMKARVEGYLLLH